MLLERSLLALLRREQCSLDAWEPSPSGQCAPDDTLHLANEPAMTAYG
jgi:hypothetical protein